MTTSHRSLLHCTAAVLFAFFLMGADLHTPAGPPVKPAGTRTSSGMSAGTATVPGNTSGRAGNTVSSGVASAPATTVPKGPRASGSTARSGPGKGGTTSRATTTAPSGVLSSPATTIPGGLRSSGSTTLRATPGSRGATSRVTTTAQSRATGTVPPATSFPQLTDDDVQMAAAVKFDLQTMAIVVNLTGEHPRRLIGYDEDGYQIMAPGISVLVPVERTESVLGSLRKKLQHRGYLTFVVERKSSSQSDRIGIIRSTDQFDILRIMQTDGEDSDVINQDVIDRLHAWEQKAPFDILGAGEDWVELSFRRLPDDVRGFAGEVYNFCPDAVTEGPGGIEGLAQQLRKTKRLLLRWD